MLALLCCIWTHSYAELSPYDQNKPVGWATVESTPTGGEGGECVTVTNADDLIANLSKSGKRIVYIKGAIEFTTFKKAVPVDKTLIGLPGSYLYNNNRDKSTSGILYLSRGSHNFIMRNVTFKGAGAYDCDGYDNLCIDGGYDIWVDHCDFQDGVDGNFDCKNGSNNIAVTWCRFRYLKAPMAGGSGGSGDHRFTNLWGSSDGNASKDEGKLNTTFQFCWWDEGCKERMPRVRFGKVHIINCLYKSSVANYCCGAGNNSSIYVERCAFIGVNNPYADYTKDGAKGYLTFDNCLFRNCTGNTWGTGYAFQPSQYYQLPAIDASLVEQVVTSSENGAGATLQFSECGQNIEVNPVDPDTSYTTDPTLTKRGSGSSNQEILLGQSIEPFGYSWTDAKEIVFEGLPQGVTVSATNEENRLDISGTPTEVGTFHFTVKTVGGLSEVSKSGTLIIKGEATRVADNPQKEMFQLSSTLVDDQLTLYIDTKGLLDLSLFDLYGKRWKHIRRNCNGEASIEINTSRLANGIYLIKCISDGIESEERIIVRH